MDKFLPALHRIAEPRDILIVNFGLWYNDEPQFKQVMLDFEDWWRREQQHFPYLLAWRETSPQHFPLSEVWYLTLLLSCSPVSFSDHSGIGGNGVRLVCSTHPYQKHGP